MTTTAFITHRDCWLHDMGSMHPECPDRLAAINDRLIAAGLDMYISFYDAPVATHEQITRAHSQSYLDELLSSVPEHGIRHLDPDTAMSPGTMKAALRSAGAGVLATDMVIAGEIENAFCAVRPPGHHAERGKAMGFCFINNVAVAARHALEVHGLERVAIVDFDVHHGNGTQAAFERDPAYLYISTHQAYIYPGTGRRSERGVGNIVNVPLTAGSGSAELREAWREDIEPALQQFKPQLILISAGFDAHYLDPLAELNFSEDDYAWLTRRIVAVARKFGQGRVVSVLEGGYNLPALAASAAAHVGALMEDAAGG